MTRHSVNSSGFKATPTPSRAAPTPAPDPLPPEPPQFAHASASVTEELNAAYTLQNLHQAATMTMPVLNSAPEMSDVDFLTCGNCQKEFLLSEIVKFMKHKKLDCRDNSFPENATDLYQRLMCQIKNCQQKFSTAWGLLQHVQNSHALNLFLTSSLYGQGIESVRVEQPVDPSNKTLDVNTLLGFGDTFDDRRQTVETQTADDECEDPCEDICAPEICAIRKCCDSQNCCITILPGSHERPKRCCASVVPKKRKQHMEQHNTQSGPASRTRRKRSAELRHSEVMNEPDRIFIDFGGPGPMDEQGQTLQQQNPSYDQQWQNGGYVQVEGTNMFVRNPENVDFSVGEQQAALSQDFTLPEPFQTLLMDDLPLGIADTAQQKDDDGKKKRYPTSRPFKCEDCGMAFNQRIHLKKHLSKHTGIKPFKCGQCNYSTVERSHLKVHIRIHTGEKPFKCDFCEYATAQNSTLKIHLKRHHSGMTLNCTVCGKNFDQPKKFTEHKKEHQSPSDDISDT